MILKLRMAWIYQLTTQSIQGLYLKPATPINSMQSMTTLLAEIFTALKISQP